MSKNNTLENKKNRKLEKQLIAYSLAAGTALLGTSSLKAAIQYTNLGEGINLYTDGAVFDIDFDTADGMTNFAVFFGTYSNRVNVDFRSDNASWRGGNGWSQGDTLVAGAVAFDFGQTINGGAQWGHEATHEMTSTYGNMAFNTAKGDGGSFINTTEKYLGVRFNIGANRHYGWIQVDVGGVSMPTNAVIKGYAYNDVADGSITAGQTIPEAGSLALLALGAAGLAAWRKNR